MDGHTPQNKSVNASVLSTMEYVVSSAAALTDGPAFEISEIHATEATLIGFGSNLDMSALTDKSTIFSEVSQPTSNFLKYGYVYSSKLRFLRIHL